MQDVLRTVDGFRSLRALVIGEAMLDCYLEGSTPRLCREAPVPVVTLSGRTDVPGGAANTAANLRALGAHVTLLSAVGDDAEGASLRHELETLGVVTSGILAVPGRVTLAKHRVLADGQMVVRYDQGTTAPLDRETEARVIRRLTALYRRSDCVVISDYDYGILTPRIRRCIETLQASHPRLLVVDARQPASYRSVGCWLVKPNFEEACQLLGQAIDLSSRMSVLSAQGERILELTGARMAAVTLDRDGALLFERGRLPYRTSAQTVRNAHVAGAGDTFVSAFALAVAAGAASPAAADIASAAAAVVVAKDGTACCTASELRARLGADSRQVLPLEALVDRLAGERQQGRRVVFTNGCFDILHSGHVTYLNHARTPGDVLVVGVNADESVRRLKGPERPVNNLEDRMRVLAALNCVDYVVPFEEDTPERIIRAIRPDVYVKGGDYTEETLPEAPLVRELGGAVRILPFVEDRSTSRIIARIQHGAEANAAPGLTIKDRELPREHVGLGESPALRPAG